MGTFRVAVEIGDAAGERWESVEALVDTGATYTSVPAPLLERLGVTPQARATFVLADGRRVARDISRRLPIRPRRGTAHRARVVSFPCRGGADDRDRHERDRLATHEGVR